MSMKLFLIILLLLVSHTLRKNSIIRRKTFVGHEDRCFFFLSTRVSSVFHFLQEVIIVDGGVAFDLYSGSCFDESVFFLIPGFVSENFQIALIVHEKFSSQQVLFFSFSQIGTHDTSLDKNIRPCSKVKKKILFTIFKIWKSDIWKISFRDI